MVHSGCPLAPSPRCSLSIQVLRLGILSRLLWLHCRHLLSVRCCLRRVRRGCTLVIRCVHVIVRVRLSMRVLRCVLVHLHVRVCGILRRLSLLCGKRLLLLLLSTLLGHTLEALLFLYARGWGATGAGLQSHRWHERTGKLGLRDEGVQLGLSRRPSFKRVEIEQTLCKVDECGSVGHFYAVSAYILRR